MTWLWLCPIQGLNVIHRLTLHMVYRYNCIKFEVFSFNYFKDNFVAKDFEMDHVSIPDHGHLAIVCHTKANASHCQAVHHMSLALAVSLIFWGAIFKKWVAWYWRHPFGILCRPETNSLIWWTCVHTDHGISIANRPHLCTLWVWCGLILIIILIHRFIGL